MEKIAMITGVSRSLGLGFAVARRLADLGYHVILTARDVAAAEALAKEICGNGLSATAARLDVGDPASVRQLAAQLSARISHLDVLVNNASAMPDFETRSPLAVDPVALRKLFEVSVFGCWQLTQALLPLLSKAPAARVVNVSSTAVHQIGRRGSGPIFSPAYSLAKHTLNALTETLASALSDTPILVNAVDPGSVATHPERGDDEDDRSPDEAAAGIVWAATLGRDGPSGGFFHDGEPVESPPL